MVLNWSVVTGFCLLLAGAVSADSLPPLRATPGSRLAAARVPVAQKRPNVARRRGASSSCAKATGGGGAVFGGYENNVEAVDSGIFEGADNSVCDTNSAIVGGQSNAIDSGYGANGNYSSYSIIGAGASNSIANAGYSMVGAGSNNSAGAPDAFIGAGYGNAVTGGGNSFVGSGSENSASGYGAFLGAGGTNSVSGTSAFIGAGALNIAGASYDGIAAGVGNVVSGPGSFIGGGGDLLLQQIVFDNASSDQISGTDSFIGAGDQNVVAANESFVGSGALNSVASGATYATILGGNHNDVTAEYASILGGYGNKATGSYAIVAGGDTDTAAGIVSFAAGYHADAGHNGSFVWSDYSSGSAAVKDTAINQFVVRASGGTYVYSNEAATAGVRLSAGSGSWASLSDRNAKRGVAPIDDASILAKVTALPVTDWSYTSESGARHIGPMAQDFYAAFGVGEDDRHITSIDEDGVALAAIKALAAQNAALRGKVTRLESVSADRAVRDDAMLARLRALDIEVRRLQRAK